MEKYKDDEGHTIYLKNKCSSILAECPFCNKVKEFKNVTSKKDEHF